jgi:nuclease-like protein
MGIHSLLENAEEPHNVHVAAKAPLLRLSLGLLAICAALHLMVQGQSSLNLFGFFVALLGLLTLDAALVPVLGQLWRPQSTARRHSAEETVDDMLSSLARDPCNFVVIKNISIGTNDIDYVVLRRDGALFVIESKLHGGVVTDDQGELRRNGVRLEKDFIRPVHSSTFGLRSLILDEFGIDVRIRSVIVFPNATVRVRHCLRGVDVVGVSDLQRWMARAAGCPDSAQVLWPRRGVLTSRLLTVA